MVAKSVVPGTHGVHGYATVGAPSLTGRGGDKPSTKISNRVGLMANGLCFHQRTHGFMQEGNYPGEDVDLAYRDHLKLSVSGYVYVRRIFESGQVEYMKYDIEDPGENRTPVTAQAYFAVRADSFER